MGRGMNLQLSCSINGDLQILGVHRSHDFALFFKGLEEPAGYKLAAIPGYYSSYVRGIEAVKVQEKE